jgi:hypothetical protein
MIKSHNLTDQLRALWHKRFMDDLIHVFEPFLEGILNAADPM